MNKLMKKGLDGTQLKYIGAFLMVCDHIHQMFAYAGAPMWLTMLGRLVFPIFIFMTAEGFHYTRSKKKYMGRLLVGFWAMNVMTFIIQKVFFMEEVVLMNNIFGTLFLSTCAMYVIDLYRNKKMVKGSIVLTVLLLSSLVFLVCFSFFPTIISFLTMLVPTPLFVEGGPIFIILGALLYLYRERRPMQFFVLAVVAVISTGFSMTNLFTTNIQWMMVFSILPLSLYNGKKGSGHKYFFYIFYPAHIYLLYAVSYIYMHYMM